MTWAAVIGSPIEHSLSPVIHRAAWAQLGIEGGSTVGLSKTASHFPVSLVAWVLTARACR